MALKWFKGRSGSKQELDVSDLIVLQRYDEAATRLEKQIKNNPRDLNARLKVAQVYTEQRKYEKAIAHYTYTADSYSEDGFHDKGMAILAKAVKMAPGDPSLQQRMERLKRAKDKEHMGDLLVQYLKESEAGGGARLSSAELSRVWPHLGKSEVVERLSLPQLKQLIPALELRQLGAEETLAEKGSRLAELFLVAEGTVSVVDSNPGGAEVTVRSFSSGDIVGEGALFEHKPWPATYRTAAPTIVLKLTKEGMEQAMRGNPDPRELLSALRQQGNDLQIRSAMKKLEAPPREVPADS